MAKSSKVPRKSGSRLIRPTSCMLAPSPLKVSKKQKKCSAVLKKQKKEWDDAICSVCLEFPHNAVLLLCSSYNKGCRPYMCATSYRFSHCLEQYKKAYTKVCSKTQQSYESTDGVTYSLESDDSNEKMEVMELLCPLCRGQVKGWTVVEAARKYLNAKKRSCMHDGCGFNGSYKGLRKHVKVEHPSARPRDVDPALEEKWKRLETEREREDVISTIHSSMPGAVVVGDYAIEGGFSRFFTDFNLDDFFGDITVHVEPSGSRRSGSHHSRRRSHHSLFGPVIRRPGRLRNRDANRPRDTSG